MAEFEEEKRRDYIDSLRMTIPAEYRNANPARAMPSSGSHRARWWTGDSGQGKSCAMALYALEEANQGTPFQWCTMREVAIQAQAKTMGEPNKWHKLLTTPLLCIDDVGQVKWTEAFSVEFHDLLEKRHGSQLRIGWTSQWSIVEQRAMMIAGMGGGSDAIKRANAMLRRMTFDQS